MKVKSLSCVRLFAAPWTVARQTPLSMGFFRQEYWSGLPFPSPGDLPDPGIEPGSPTSPASAGGFFITSATWKADQSALEIRREGAAGDMKGLFKSKSCQDGRNRKK